jgi:hypothetical protein
VEGYGGSGRIDESFAAFNKQLKAILQRFIRNGMPIFILVHAPFSVQFVAFADGSGACACLDFSLALCFP